MLAMLGLKLLTSLFLNWSFSFSILSVIKDMCFSASSKVSAFDLLLEDVAWVWVYGFSLILEFILSGGNEIASLRCFFL